jgi:hypothetical protein
MVPIKPRSNALVTSSNANELQVTQTSEYANTENYYNGTTVKIAKVPAAIDQ